MNLWQLKIFCKVVELRSFSKAGEAIHLSQPTVSSHIKDLEEHLGTQLVDRLSRQTVPTKAGELLYSYAHKLIALREETEAVMAEFLGTIKGRLSIGGSTIPGTYLLPQLIGAFTQHYSEVRIALRVSDTADILDKIETGDIEIGIVGARSEENRLLQEPLIEDELRLVVPPTHKWADRKQVSLNELVTEPFIIREAGSGTRRSIENKVHENGGRMDAFHIVAEMGSTEAVRQGIKSSVGISILSAIAVADDVKNGTLKTLHITDMNLKRHF